MILSEQDLHDYNQRRPPDARNIACHAPFKSIFFNVYGRMIVCCFNRHYNLGKYPEKTLKEMWFGEEAEKIREAIKKNDLSLGCAGCYNLIKAKNFAALPSTVFDSYSWNPQGYPTKIDFELANICNLECVMCKGNLSSSIRRNRDKKPPMPIHYDKEFVRQLEEFIPHLENSHFLGGEPFLNPIYFDLWDRMVELNPKMFISIQTNATVLNNRVKSILNKIPVSIAVSLDSLKKETYEAIRINANFERMMSNLHFFRDYCRANNTSFTLSFCPMPSNWRELPDVVHFCNNLEVPVFFNTVTDPYDHSLMYLPSKQLFEIHRTLAAADLPENTDLQKANKRGYADIVQQMKYWSEQAAEKEQLFSGNNQPPDNLDEFYARLEKYIQHLDSEDRHDLFDNMKEKIEYVVDNATKIGHQSVIFYQVYNTDMKHLCQHIPIHTKEHLFEMFKETVL